MTNLRKLARGQECLVRLPGCLGGGETVVLAHYRLAGYCGTGLKPPELMAAWACSHCHDLIDGRAQIKGLPKGMDSHTEVRLAHAEAVMRTVEALRKLGVFGK